MDRISATRILVTGATGRVGALLRAAWARELPQAFAPIWQTRGAAPDGWLAWDMLAEPCPPLSPAPAVILNLAGVTGTHPDRLWQNTALARAARTAARRYRCRHLFLVSSAAVFGPGAPDHPQDEDTPLYPATPYGAAKAAMERAAEAWPATTCLRIGNIAGADSLLGTRPEAEVILDPIPSAPTGPTRSWIGPITLARTLARLIEAALAGQHLPRTLNIAQSPALPMDALLDAAALSWRFGPPRPETIAHVSLGTSRLAGFVTLPPASPAQLVGESHSLGPE